MLNEKELRDANRCCKGNFDCCKCVLSKLCSIPGKATREAAQTALVYREMLKKVLRVMEGFDYRANINFTLSDCLGVETEAKALLKDGEKE